MKKLLAISTCLLLLPAVAMAMTGEEVYQKTCSMCHDSGVAGAPKLGDKEAWAPRIAAGMESMYHIALNGEGAMPPKGGNSALSDDEVKAAVDYMVGKSK